MPNKLPTTHHEAQDAAAIRREATEFWAASHLARPILKAPEVPENIASEAAQIIQERMSTQKFADESYFELKKSLYEAVCKAEDLDFQLIANSDDPNFIKTLNSMSGKFKTVSRDELINYLGDNRLPSYEPRALRIIDLISNHSPDLLTPDLQTIQDAEQTPWRRSSAYASILLRQLNPNSSRSKRLNAMTFDALPVSLPISDRMNYMPEEDTPTPISEMNESDLALHCQPEAIKSVKERNAANFNDLTHSAKETLLAHRIFRSIAQSNTESLIARASQRNKLHENEPLLQKHNLVHATRPELLDDILKNGLLAGETIIKSNSGVVSYPFTVSFMEVGDEVQAHESMPDKLEALRNSTYGCINLIFKENQDQIRLGGPPDQRQVFGGVPSTEISAIIVGDLDRPEPTKDTLERTIKSILRHGQFIPVYDGLGQAVLTSELYEELKNLD